VKRATGKGACPFNFLYWDFIGRHAERFGRNPRMAMPIRTLMKMAPEKVAAMKAEARAFLDGLADAAVSPAPAASARQASLDIPPPPPAPSRAPRRRAPGPG